jgi:hypothetical protein
MPKSIRKYILWKYLFIWSTAALLLLLGFSILLPLPPYGRYRIEGIGNFGISYFEFNKGKAQCIVTDGYGPQAEVHRNLIGSYRKIDGKWLIDADGDLGRLSTTLWRIQICDTNGNNPATFWRMFSFP